jgi:hypothetical protein
LSNVSTFADTAVDIVTVYGFARPGATPPTQFERRLQSPLAPVSQEIVAVTFSPMFYR